MGAPVERKGADYMGNPPQCTSTTQRSTTQLSQAVAKAARPRSPLRRCGNTVARCGDPVCGGRSTHDRPPQTTRDARPPPQSRSRLCKRGNPRTTLQCLISSRPTRHMVAQHRTDLPITCALSDHSPSYVADVNPDTGVAVPVDPSHSAIFRCTSHLNSRSKGVQVDHRDSEGVASHERPR
jgi:hypothetical protein